MKWVVHHLWVIPALPLLAAGLTAVCRQPQRRLAAGLAIGALGLACLLTCAAFATTLGPVQAPPPTGAFTWFQLGERTVPLGWVLDPLAALMLVMVSFVGLLIFIYSVGYMAADENFTRFFCFLSLFAAAMLGLVIANNLLLLFMCWELVGFTSYLLIGFWYHKPSAAAAAKKAFICTRIGDLGFFLGLIWLYAETGTLMFFDAGQGCLENAALAGLAGRTTLGGLAISSAIGLLLFCGAVGKSGQAPLHVWLPDAMEGPTPVSALIHAATMVAAGVFLMARIYPLMDADAAMVPGLSVALSAVVWVGAITAVLGALLAVAQTDLKRILAYSTVSQLGYMMLGLGVGGVAVGLFHLITHAFFKALLFLGAGSVLHGCHGRQDICQMGGLRKFMPATFATYAVGMMALCGVPLFSGFWSKEEILHAAQHWPVSHAPFYLGLAGALLTAFYMTRQVCRVFFGPYRGQAHLDSDAPASTSPPDERPQESPPVMTVPLAVLAFFALLLGFLGTPAWPWFEAYVNGRHAHPALAPLFQAEVLKLFLCSTALVAAGLGAGWWLYGRQAGEQDRGGDALERLAPGIYRLLAGKFYVDELYEATVIQWQRGSAWLSDWGDRHVWEGMVRGVAFLTRGGSRLSQWLDESVVNVGFDQGCERLRHLGHFLARFQDGQIQRYLRVIGVALAVLLLLLLWGCGQ